MLLTGEPEDSVSRADPFSGLIGIIAGRLGIGTPNPVGAVKGGIS
jgi:hypothetical protein